MEGAAGNKRLSSSTACAGSTNVLVYQKLCCRARSVGLLNCHPGIAQASGKKHLLQMVEHIEHCVQFRRHSPAG
jgi:hypothetical protein